MLKWMAQRSPPSPPQQVANQLGSPTVFVHLLVAPRRSSVGDENLWMPCLWHKLHKRVEAETKLAADAMPFEHLAPASCKFLALTPRKRHPTVKSKHCLPWCCFIFWKQYRTSESCKYKQVPSFWEDLPIPSRQHARIWSTNGDEAFTRSAESHAWTYLSSISIRTLDMEVPPHWFHNFQCERSDSDQCSDDSRIKPPRLEFDLRFAQDDVASQLNLGYLAG